MNPASYGDLLNPREGLEVFTIEHKCQFLSIHLTLKNHKMTLGGKRLHDSLTAEITIAEVLV